MHFKNPFKKSHDKLDKFPLADYDVGDTLGEGGYGVVKQAHQKGADQGMDVAIKIVPRHHVAPGREALKELTNRLRKMQTLSEHPHVVKLIEWRVNKTTIYTFYELCRGKDLFDRILDRPDGRFTENQARDATRALTDTLDYLHDKGLMHRDVKPENVLYRTVDGPFDDLVLADFGLAYETNPGEIIQGAAGSPGYWSPEMCAGKGYSMLADEWALGIVIYAMLSGRSPFRSLEPDELRRECAKADITYPKKYWDGVSDSALDFVKRLLTVDPSQRMTVKEALKHKWLTESPSEKEPAPDSERHHDESDTHQPGRLERRPTHGLTPAGLSMRFDKPREPVREESDADDDGEATLAPSVHSPEPEDVHVLHAHDVLSGNVSADKLETLSRLDDHRYDSTETPTPIEGRSRNPSQDLSAMAAIQEGLDKVHVDGEGKSVD